jgi:hypothetical protein
MAETTDKFIKTKRLWVGQVGAGGVSSPSATTIPFTGSGLNNDEVYTVVINRVDANGNKITPRNDEVFIGKVQSGNFINCIRGVEGTAAAWVAGTVLEILITETQMNRMVDGITIEHAQDGTHKIGAAIYDANGNEIIETPATASAVNNIKVINATTGNAPQITASGNDTNINLKISGKGTGKVVLGSGNLLFPNSDGTSNQALVTDGSGNLSFATINKPGVLLTKSAAQSISNTTWTLVSWDQEQYDTDTMHDNTTNNTRITIKTAGVYLFTFSGEWAVNSTGVRLAAFSVNSGQRIVQSLSPATSDSRGAFNLSMIRKLAVNDYVEVSVYQNSGGNLNLVHTNPPESQTQFAAQMIGPA